MSIVQGKIDIELDDSSDSEEESENLSSTIENIQFEENDEENVEYFGNESKVKVVESNVSGQGLPKKAVFAKEMVQETKTAPAIIAQPDEFGIQYQSYRKPTNGNGSQPVVLDGYSDEIEQRLLLQSQNNVLSNAAEDEEFDIDGYECDVNSATNNTIRKALEQAAAVYNANVDANALNEVVMSDGVIDPSSFSTETVQEDASISLDSAASSSIKSNVFLDAQKALKEVMEVYSSGLGDQEVLLLNDISISGTSTSQSKQQHTSLLKEKLNIATTIIEEEDEEAAEQEESEDIQREEQAKLDELMKQRQLEQQWGSLNDTVATNDKHSDVAEQLKYNNFTASVDKCDYVRNSETTTSLTMNNNTTTTTMTYNSALKYFQSQDFSHLLNSIVTSEQPTTSVSSSSSNWFGFISNSSSSGISYPGYNKDDLNLPFLIALLDYDPQQQPQHTAMLRTIYNFFVNTTSNDNNNSEHYYASNSNSSNSFSWEKIGFQGNDPRTDLNRSMKMLSVLQMLYLMESDPSLARRLFTLSQSDHGDVAINKSSSTAPSSSSSRSVDSSWPFMCVSIMFTKESLQALRRGALNGKCSKRQSVLYVLHEFHRACFAEFDRLLVEQPTVFHAVHLATIRKLCEGNPLKLLKKHKQMRTNTTSSSSSNTTTAAVTTSLVASKPAQKQAVDPTLHSNTSSSSSSSSNTTSSSTVMMMGGDSDFKFHNLESIIIDESCNDNSSVDDTTNTSSIFSSNSKASKFRA